MSEVHTAAPQANDSVRTNWTINGPINDRLAQVTQQVTASFLTDVGSWLVPMASEERAALVQSVGNVYELDYNPMGEIPPAVFGMIDKNGISQTRPLWVPPSNRIINNMADDYDQWSDIASMGRVDCREAFLRKEKVVDILQAHRGRRYPKDTWVKAAMVTRAALINEPNFIIDIHYGNIFDNGMPHHSELSQAEREIHRQYGAYVLTMTKRVNLDYEGSPATRHIIQLPITEYGPAASAKLARATLALTDRVQTSKAVGDSVTELLTPDNEALLNTYTARSRENTDMGLVKPTYRGLKATLSEGIFTVAQAVTLLTAEKIEGYDTHDSAVKAILDSDIIEQFTRLIEPGYIGPVTWSGLYMAGMVEVKRGKPVLSRHAVEYWRERRKEYMIDMAAKWALYRVKSSEVDQPDMLGLVCPAAKPNGSIAMAKNALKYFYQ